jgi:hypothetical protein
MCNARRNRTQQSKRRTEIDSENDARSISVSFLISMARFNFTSVTTCPELARKTCCFLLQRSDSKEQIQKDDIAFNNIGRDNLDFLYSSDLSSRIGRLGLAIVRLMRRASGVRCCRIIVN